MPAWLRAPGVGGVKASVSCLRGAESCEGGTLDTDCALGASGQDMAAFRTGEVMGLRGPPTPGLRPPSPLCPLAHLGAHCWAPCPRSLTPHRHPDTDPDQVTIRPPEHTRSWESQAFPWSPDTSTPGRPGPALGCSPPALQAALLGGVGGSLPSSQPGGGLRVQAQHPGAFLALKP